MGKPLVHALGNVAASKNPDAAKASLEVLIDKSVSLVQTVVCSESECKRRTSFYVFDGDRLVRRAQATWAGARASRHDWIPGRSGHDNEVLQFAHGEDARLVEDLERVSPPYFIDPKGRCYKSFAAVPVRAGNASYGLLTADADRAHALTPGLPT